MNTDFLACLILFLHTFTILFFYFSISHIVALSVFRFNPPSF